MLWPVNRCTWSHVCYHPQKPHIPRKSTTNFKNGACFPCDDNTPLTIKKGGRASRVYLKRSDHLLAGNSMPIYRIHHTFGMLYGFLFNFLWYKFLTYKMVPWICHGFIGSWWFWPWFHNRWSCPAMSSETTLMINLRFVLPWQFCENAFFRRLGMTSLRDMTGWIGAHQGSGGVINGVTWDP